MLVKQEIMKLGLGVNKQLHHPEENHQQYEISHLLPLH
jgi:hypothetical protein